jgi:hypothetical protein
MRENVLKGHIKKKGVFISPFNYNMITFKELSWVNTILPELFWIALLIQMNGEKTGIDTALALCKACLEVKEPEDFPFYGNMSLFTIHSDEERKSIRDRLSYKQKVILAESLDSFFSMYPENPLQYLRNQEQSTKSKDHLLIISETIKELFDKTTRLAIETQAALMYFGFESGKFHVAEGLNLASFPEIQNYPDTELSRMVAASIRSSTPIFISQQLEKTGDKWSYYFWNRGLEISSCILGEESE